MKILHVIHSANPVGGGPIEAVRQLTAVHEEAGHQSEVASLDPAETGWGKAMPFRCHSLGTAVSSYGYSAKLIPWLQANRARFDIVVSHGLWQFNGVAVHRSLRGSGTPYCVFPHGMLDPWFKQRYPLKHLKKWLYWLTLERQVLREAAGVLFTCEEERLQAASTFWPYQAREKVVSFGTADPDGESEAQRAVFFERFPALKEKRLLLFLGRIHEKKGCRELLKAFRQISDGDRSTGCPLHLVMAGPADNAYGKELQRWAAGEPWAQNVTWTGMLAGDVKWGAFRAAEAFILPSHQENFGIAVAEAMACGLPVLISNKVNIWREIEQDGAGLVEADGPEGTLRLLQRWLALDESKRAEMRTAARRSFEERFEIRRAATDLLGVFEALTARCPRNPNTALPAESARIAALPTLRAERAHDPAP